MGSDGMLVAARLPHAKRTRLWLCPALTDISECHTVDSPRLSRAEYVDDMGTFERHTYWVLTIDPDRQRSFIHVTTNGGSTWVQHAAPSRGLAAGSWGTLQVFDQRQGVLTQYTANGPVVAQFRTNDAGASWQRLGKINVG